MDIDKIFQECTGFDWDKYNSVKIFEKHNVLQTESEQVFFNKPLMVALDIKHSQKEKRFYALGSTDNYRKLFVAFTIRNNLIRIISCRDMSRKERKFYEKENS